MNIKGTRGTDEIYYKLLDSIIGDVLEGVIDGPTIVDEDTLRDIILADCMEQIDYDHIRLQVGTIAREIFDKEANKIFDILGYEQ